MRSNNIHTVVNLKKLGFTLSQENRYHICSDKIKTSVSRCTAYVYKYCSRSGLHGLNYVGDVRRPLIERVFWLALFCISFTVCSFLIRSVWIKWKTTPVVVTFSDTPTPVWEVPFPAVTVCSQNKIGKQIFNVAHEATVRHQIPEVVPGYIATPFNDGLNEVEERNNKSGEFYASQSGNITKPSNGEDTHQRQKRFDDMSLWCNEDTFDADKNVTDYRIIHRIKEEAPSLNQTIGFVKWKNHEVELTKYFRPILTQNGLCYTFNMMDDDDIYKEEVLGVMKRNNDQLRRRRRNPQWSPENGFEKASGFNTYPARTPGSGIYSELYVMLKGIVFGETFKCKGPVEGFKVQVHSPAEVPALAKQYFRVRLGEDMSVAVKPSTLTTAEALHGYSPQHRQCYFSDERYLRFFRKYSQRSCELECFANDSLANCGCVPFYLPRTEDTPICNVGRKECLKQLGEDRVEKVVRKFEDGGSIGGYLDVTGCDCLPSCTELSYDVQVSQADIDGESYETAMRRINFSFEYKLLGLSVYFKDMTFLGRHRSELYGITDFIANCGGLLGLFMGFSILSLIEVIYFFTLRVVFSVGSKRTKSTQTTKQDQVDSTNL